MTIPVPGSAHADIVDPDAYLDGVPHATFARLRHDDPVSWWDEHDGGRGFWAVTRYDDLLRVSRETSVFSSAQGIILEEPDPEDFAKRRNMMEYDAPEHTRYRRLVSKPFARREVMAYEQAIRALAVAVLDEALPPGVTRTFDFTEDVAKQLPMRMLGRLLGVPDEDGPWLVHRGDAMLGNFDPEMTQFPIGLTDTDEFKSLPFRSPAALELFRYAEREADKRHATPTNDVITALLSPTVDGDRLTDQEFKNFFILLVGAGNDTSRYSMAAGFKALIDHPDQRAMLTESIGNDPVVMERAVEEICRFATPTMHFRRTATQDVEMGGKLIRKGDKVVIWFVSADFDESVFPDPHRFDITRWPNDHVAFGRMSPHLCLGAQLARLEIKVLMEEMLPRLASVEMAGPVEYLRSNFISGMKHLPVTITTHP